MNAHLESAGRNDAVTSMLKSLPSATSTRRFVTGARKVRNANHSSAGIIVAVTRNGRSNTAALSTKTLDSCFYHILITC